MTEWLTRQEVAEYLGISLRHTYSLDIPRSKLGRLPRFERAAIDAWLRQRSETPDAPRAKGRRPTFGPLRRGSDLADFNARLRKALGR